MNFCSEINFQSHVETHDVTITYIQYAAVMCARLCDAGDAVASPAAEISVVALWMNDPVVPAYGGEIDVERVAAALARVWSAVHASRLSADCSLRKRVDDDERLAIVVHRDGQGFSAASLAGNLNRMRQIVVLHPVFHRPRDVDLLPCFVALVDFPYRQRLCFREVAIGPPMANLR